MGPPTRLWRAVQNVMFDYDGEQLDALATCRYHDEVVAPVADHWDEIMLSAAIWFLVDEIGIRKIYLHDHVSGAKLKSINGTFPPHSLYTRLPKRFCFTETTQGPYFLMRKNAGRLRSRVKKGDLSFWRLQV